MQPNEHTSPSEEPIQELLHTTNPEDADRIFSRYVTAARAEADERLSSGRDTGTPESILKQVEFND